MLLMVLANLALLVIGLLTARISARVMNVNPRTVWTSVTVLCVVGSFAINGSFWDVGVMFCAAILGSLFKRCGFAPGPFILGPLLGGMPEGNLRRALVMSQDSGFGIFFSRPASGILTSLTILTLIRTIARLWVKGKKEALTNGGKGL
ncbi:MAG: tripartite tricarboxylate transporter permease [Planctomycetota bacterium]|jgi:putative tricarboxylic transport membrane protein|nr:tripartite tricarboxylate transporter permease [Planctomycetota bacterium]